MFKDLQPISDDDREVGRQLSLENNLRGDPYLLVLMVSSEVGISQYGCVDLSGSADEYVSGKVFIRANLSDHTGYYVRREMNLTAYTKLDAALRGNDSIDPQLRALGQKKLKLDLDHTLSELTQVNARLR